MKRVATLALALLAAAALLIARDVRHRPAEAPAAASRGSAGVAPAAVAPATAAVATAAPATSAALITHLTAEDRQRIASQLDAAHHAHTTTAPPRLPEGSAEDDTMTTAQQVLTQLQQATDQIRDDVAACGKLAPEVKAFNTQIMLSGDPDIGTLIDAPAAGATDDGKPLPAAFEDCVRGHLQLLELPPMKTDAQFSVKLAISFD